MGWKHDPSYEKKTLRDLPGPVIHSGLASVHVQQVYSPAPPKE